MMGSHSFLFSLIDEDYLLALSLQEEYDRQTRAQVVEDEITLSRLNSCN